LATTYLPRRPIYANARRTSSSQETNNNNNNQHLHSTPQPIHPFHPFARTTSTPIADVGSNNLGYWIPQRAKDRERNGHDPSHNATQRSEPPFSSLPDLRSLWRYLVPGSQADPSDEATEAPLPPLMDLKIESKETPGKSTLDKVNKFTPCLLLTQGGAC